MGNAERETASRRHTWFRGGSAAALCAAVAASAFMPFAPAAAAGSDRAACASSAAQAGPTRIGTIGGLVRPITTGGACNHRRPAGESPYVGSPPLIYHSGGPVMSTPSAGDQVVVTPIYWAPSGYSFTSTYKNVINGYLANVAADSDKTTNVFASDFQYSGSNGSINYRVSVTAPVTDTSAYPAAGCTLNAGAIYSDSSGYTTCLDDGQIQIETANVIAAHTLPTDLGHMYVMFLPKHVESCFYAGNPANQACTINYSPSSAYCAYHSAFGTGLQTIYATMPFPIYQSGTARSCTNQNLGGGIQTPNGDIDADVEVSPLSHEMNEAITDPNLNAWYDAAGNENGDDCAYIYGALSGTAGAYYNQTVHGSHYLTQEEFSNANYVAGVSGCIQGIQPVVPSVTSLSHSSGHGGQIITITGSGFPGANAVHFGTTSAIALVVDATHIAAMVPSHAAGTVDVTVTTGAGSSAASTADHFTYILPPVVKKVSPSSGTKAGGTKVTIKGKNFTSAATVKFGTKAGKSVNVVSSKKITAKTPKHAKGKVDVVVKTANGTSKKKKADHYTFK